MNYLELTEKRESIRNFKDRQVPENVVRDLRLHFAKIPHLIPDVETKLTFHGNSIEEALKRSAGYEGMTFGAPLYVIVWAENSPHALYEAGYAAEELLLKITEMGLASCLLSITDVEGIKNAIGGPRDLEAAIVIAVGPGKKERSRKLLHILTPSDVQITEVPGHIAPKITMDAFVLGDVDLADDTTDPLLRDALYAASLAPSFLNRQQVRVALEGGKMTWLVRKDTFTDARDAMIGLGCAIRNFDAVYYRSGQVTFGSCAGDFPEGYTAKGWRML